MPWEIRLGRALAFCCHPVLTWCCCSRRGRTVIVAACFSAGYAVVLAGLFAF